MRYVRLQRLWRLVSFRYETNGFDFEEKFCPQHHLDIYLLSIIRPSSRCDTEIIRFLA